MADDARELLKRLVAWREQRPRRLDDLFAIMDGAASVLAREQDGPVAEGAVSFYSFEEQGKRIWRVCGTNDDDADETTFCMIRVPVPRRLYAHEYIVGSVVEPQEGDDGR